MKNQTTILTRVLLLTVILHLSAYMYSQARVIYEDKSADDHWITDLVEDKDGNFVYVGRYYYDDTEKWIGYVAKVSPEGVRLAEYINPHRENESRFESVNITNDGTFIITGGESFSDNSGLIIMEFDKDLNLMWSKYSKIIDACSNLYRNRVIEIGDGNYAGIFIECVVEEGDTPKDHYENWHNYLFKFSRDGDLLALEEDMASEKVLGTSSDILSLNNGEKFFIISASMFSIVNSDLKLIETMPQNAASLGNTFYSEASCKQLSDGRIFCGSGHWHSENRRSRNSLIFIELEEDYKRGKKFKLIDERAILNEPNSSTYTSDIAEKKAVGFVDENNLIIGGTLNVYNKSGVSFRPYMTEPSLLSVTSFDKDLNKNWELYYEDEASYYMMSLCATRDGGAVITAIKYTGDNAYNDSKSTIVLIKFNNPNTSVNNIADSKFSIYPNPASTDINFKFDGESAVNRVSFYDAIGRLCKSIEIHSSEESVDVSDLSRGVYVVKATSGKLVLGNQKLIVK